MAKESKLQNVGQSEQTEDCWPRRANCRQLAKESKPKTVGQTEQAEDCWPKKANCRLMRPMERLLGKLKFYVYESRAAYATCSCALRVRKYTELLNKQKMSEFQIKKKHVTIRLNQHFSYKIHMT